MHRDDIEIGRELLGYKKDDVDLLLVALNRDLKNAREKNFDLLNKNEELRLKLDGIADNAEKLRTTLENSERTSRLLIGQAKADADAILGNAYQAASRILDETEISKKRIVDALSELDDADRRLSESFSKTLKSYIELIEAVTKRVDQNESSAPVEPPNISDNGNRFNIDYSLDSASFVSMPSADVAILKAHMGPLIDIDGVSAALLFSNDGSIITHIAGPDVNIEDFLIIQKSFGRWSSQMSSVSDIYEMKQAFIQLKDIVFTFQPIDDSVSICIVLSGNAKYDLVASLINEKREHISRLISSVLGYADN